MDLHLPEQLCVCNGVRLGTLVPLSSMACAGVGAVVEVCVDKKSFRKVPVHSGQLGLT